MSGPRLGGWWVFAIAALAILPASSAGSDVRTLRGDWNRVLNVELDPAGLDRYPYISCFRQAAARYGIPLQLLLGIAWGESAFNPTARSSRNAVGIMQILWPGTARDLGFRTMTSLEDPCRNIHAGARYFRRLLDRVDGDAVLALASYNHGPNAIDGRDSNLDDHAKWYVRYIYDKTLRVLSGPGPRSGELFVRLGRFTDYDMARRSMQRYARLARLHDQVDLPLEIQRERRDRYELRVLCGSEPELARERKRYERITGFAPS